MPRTHRYFFNRPTFIEGVARAIDFGGCMTTYLECPSADVADRVALADDMLAVREDLEEAVRLIRVNGELDSLADLPALPALTRSAR